MSRLTRRVLGYDERRHIKGDKLILLSVRHNLARLGQFHGGAADRSGRVA